MSTYVNASSAGTKEVPLVLFSYHIMFTLNQLSHLLSYIHAASGSYVIVFLCSVTSLSIDLMTSLPLLHLLSCPLSSYSLLSSSSYHLINPPLLPSLLTFHSTSSHLPSLLTLPLSPFTSPHPTLASSFSSHIALVCHPSSSSPPRPQVCGAKHTSQNSPLRSQCRTAAQEHHPRMPQRK